MITLSRSHSICVLTAVCSSDEIVASTLGYSHRSAKGEWIIIFWVVLIGSDASLAFVVKTALASDRLSCSFPLVTAAVFACCIGLYTFKRLMGSIFAMNLRHAFGPSVTTVCNLQCSQRRQSMSSLHQIFTLCVPLTQHPSLVAPGTHCPLKKVNSRIPLTSCATKKPSDQHSFKWCLFTKGKFQNLWLTFWRRSDSALSRECASEYLLLGNTFRTQLKKRTVQKCSATFVVHRPKKRRPLRWHVTSLPDSFSDVAKYCCGKIQWFLADS